jgi:hypothetical protein
VQCLQAPLLRQQALHPALPVTQGAATAWVKSSQKVSAAPVSRA